MGSISPSPLWLSWKAVRQACEMKICVATELLEPKCWIYFLKKWYTWSEMNDMLIMNVENYIQNESKTKYEFRFTEPLFHSDKFWEATKLMQWWAKWK